MRRWYGSFWLQVFGLIGWFGGAQIALMAAPSVVSGGDQQFRAIYGQLLLEAGYTADEVKRLHFPFPGFFEELIQYCNETADEITACDQRVTSLRPSQFLEHSLKQDVNPPQAPAMERRQVAPTFIIIPGYVAELADITPYKDIFAAPSGLKEAWHQALAKVPSKKRTVNHYDLIEGRHVASPLEDVILAASLDRDYGQSELDLYAIRHPRGSLESLGSLVDSADSVVAYVDRLAEVMPLSGPIYFVGYSRGANVSLEILSRLARLKDDPGHPWASQMAGMISISGPLFGTPLSDNGATSQSQMNDELYKLANRMATCSPQDGVWRRWSKVHRNTKLWKRTIADLIQSGPKLEPPVELSWEGISPDALDLQQGWPILRGILFEDIFELSRPVSRYCENVERFKIFINTLQDGTRSMSTDGMRAWFAEHTLPAELDYIAVSTTMMDAARPEKVYREGENELSYRVGSLDLQLARTSYYTIFDAAGFELNDGFVPLHRSLFLPGLHQRLNPEQPDYQARAIGALWQHHLGVAIPVGLPTAEPGVSPFARRNFLKALAHFTAT
jgi:hypothetical protein